MANPQSILLVEDNLGDVRLIQELLKEAFRPSDIVLRCVSSIDEACTHISRERACDVVLLDLSLPDSHGLDTITRIHACAPQLPVVVLSGDTDEALAIAAMVAGAQDYLVKGHITAHLLRRALRFAGHRKQIEQNLVREANHDDLTGLPVIDRLEQALLGCVRKDRRGALLFVDLDEFKDINDRYGHKVGDDVLVAVGAHAACSARH